MVLSLLGYGTINDGPRHSHYWVIALSVVGHSTINEKTTLLSVTSHQVLLPFLVSYFRIQVSVCIGVNEKYSLNVAMSGQCITFLFKNRTEIHYCPTEAQCSLDQRGGSTNRSQRVAENCVVQIWRWQVRASSYNSNKLTNQMQVSQVYYLTFI